MLVFGVWSIMNWNAPMRPLYVCDQCNDHLVQGKCVNVYLYMYLYVLTPQTSLFFILGVTPLDDEDNNWKAV